MVPKITTVHCSGASTCEQQRSFNPVIGLQKHVDIPSPVGLLTRIEGRTFKSKLAGTIYVLTVLCTGDVVSSSRPACFARTRDERPKETCFTISEKYIRYIATEDLMPTLLETQDQEER